MPLFMNRIGNIEMESLLCGWNRKRAIAGEYYAWLLT